MTQERLKLIRVLMTCKPEQVGNTYDWAVEVNERMHLYLDKFIETWYRKTQGADLCYISGKITGLPKEVYMERFSECADMLSNMYDPVVVLIDAPLTWHEYMEIDLAILSLCDHIFMMRGWEDSEGAKLEHQKAKMLGIDVMYEIASV